MTAIIEIMIESPSLFRNKLSNSHIVHSMRIHRTKVPMQPIFPNDFIYCGVVMF